MASSGQRPLTSSFRRAVRSEEVRDAPPPVPNLRAATSSLSPTRRVTGSSPAPSPSLPILALGLVAWQAWGGALRVSDLIVFAILYVATCLGITVGFHRLFTHRSFKARRGVVAVFGVLGSAAIEGPLISWVADHRKHHAFSDHEGDPHSPHVGHDGGVRGALRGLFHATSAGCSCTTSAASARATPPTCSPIRCWSIGTDLRALLAGLGVPFALGWLIGGTSRRAQRCSGRRGAYARAAPRDVLDQLARATSSAPAARTTDSTRSRPRAAWIGDVDDHPPRVSRPRARAERRAVDPASAHDRRHRGTLRLGEA